VGRFIKDEEFSTYVLPFCKISEEATASHQLRKRKKKLYFNNRKVKTLSRAEALEEFMIWTSSVKNKEGNKLIVMSHGSVKRYVLIYNMLNAGIDLYEINYWLFGYVDTKYLLNYFGFTKEQQAEAGRDSNLLRALIEIAMTQTKIKNIDKFTRPGFKRFKLSLA